MVDLVYIMIQNFEFSLALKARKSSSLHTILFLNKTQTKQLVVLIYNQVIFFVDFRLDTLLISQSILTLIVLAILSAVLGTFSKQQHTALKVLLCIIFY